MRVSSGRARSEAGLSIVELMVAVTLMGVVMTAAYTMFGAASKMSDFADAQSQASDQTRQAADQITREARQSVEIVDGQGTFRIAEPGRCAFYADVDQDGTPELVTYRVSGRSIYRSVTEPTTRMPPYTYGAAGPETAIMTGLDPALNGNVFTYYNNSDPATQVSAGDYADISALAVHLSDSVTVGSTTASMDVTTWVKIRSVFNSLS